MSDMDTLRRQGFTTTDLQLDSLEAIATFALNTTTTGSGAVQHWSDSTLLRSRDDALFKGSRRDGISQLTCSASPLWWFCPNYKAAGESRKEVEAKAFLTGWRQRKRATREVVEALPLVSSKVEDRALDSGSLTLQFVEKNIKQHGHIRR
jgi:hypothetical protein